MPKKKTTISNEENNTSVNDSVIEETSAEEKTSDTKNQSEEQQTVVINVDVQNEDNSKDKEAIINDDFEKAKEIDVSEFNQYQDVDANESDNNVADDLSNEDKINSDAVKERERNIERRIATIVTDDTLPEKFSTNDRFKWAELYKYKVRNTVCEAQVIKCVKSYGGNIAVLCRIIGFEEFNMFIPFELFDAPISITTNEAKINFVNKLIGSIINVVIEQLKEGTGIANRTKADFFLRRKFYYRGFKPNINASKRVVSKGTIINNAKIIVVHQNAIQLEIFGARVRVPASELSYSMITDCRKEYSVGTTIRCVIKDINLINDEARNVRLSVSVKDLYQDDTLVALDAAQIGEMCLATVTRITYRTGSIMLYTAAGYNAIATHLTTSVSNLRVGSTVKFQLKYKKSKYGIGEIIHIISL